MGLLNSIEFVQDEISKLPEIHEKPSGGLGCFLSKIGYAIRLSLIEKEIFFFALLQWATIGFAYLLWIQMLGWIPEDVWESARYAEKGSIVDLILLAWSFVCVGLAAFPIGILTACMGATHFLYKQGRESTIATCLQIALPQSWSLWMFHWLDGWITVMQILKRLPKKDDDGSIRIDTNPISEALYYAWKLGVSGILPSMVLGDGVMRSAKNSVVFVKDNFVEVAKLRLGYSAACWGVGIATYVGSFFYLKGTGDIYSFYLLAAYPILIAVAVVMLFLRPIYIIAICSLYSDHLQQKGIKLYIYEEPSRATNILVAFACFCLVVGVAYIYRSELGIMNLLATVYV